MPTAQLNIKGDTKMFALRIKPGLEGLPSSKLTLSTDDGFVTMQFPTGLFNPELVKPDDVVYVMIGIVSPSIEMVETPPIFLGKDTVQ